MIIVNNIASAQIAGTSLTFTGRVSSADEIIVITVEDASTTFPTVTFNGTNVLATTQLLNGSSGDTANIFIVWHPPVGNYAVVITDGTAAALTANCMSLLGVSKRSTTPVIATATAGSPSTSSIVISPASANALVIQTMYVNGPGGLVTTTSGQTQIQAVGDTFGNTAVTGYKFVSPGAQNITWNLGGVSTSYVSVAVALEPDDAPSMWFPTITLRSQNDSAASKGLNTASTTPLPTSVGYFPTDFWQNSFLHTVGRVLSPPQSFSLVAETELQTSQIVVDKITQQASASGTSLTSDHLVTSQDAVMLIFASQMGVSQGLNSVTLNGVALTALGNPSVSTLTAGAYFVVNPNVGVNVISSSVTLPTALELVVVSFLGVDKKTLNPVSVANSALTGSPSSTIQVAASNSLLVDFVGSLGTSISENAAQTVYFDQPQTASEAAGSIKLSTIGSQTMSWTTLSTAWVQLTVALEPANAPSIWFPNIDQRNLSDVITVNNLDDSANPAGSFYATYGTHPTQLWQNSFLHTVGRVNAPVNTVVNASVSQVAATLTVTGGTQTVATVNDVSINQAAATLTVTGGTQSVASIQDASVTQSAATLTVTGGTQSIATVNDVAISQAHATLTVTGGTQTVATVNKVAISQVAATLTVTGGTQAVAAVQDTSISQAHATLTVTGGTQSVSTVGSVSISQAHATLTVTGGVQGVIVLTPDNFIKVINLILNQVSPLGIILNQAPPISLGMNIPSPIPMTLDIPAAYPITLNVPKALDNSFNVNGPISMTLNIPEAISLTLAAD